MNEAAAALEVPGDPRIDDVPAPPGDANVMRDARRALNRLPKYDRKGPWRTFITEFRNWVNCYDLYGAGDIFLKNAIIMAMMGPAAEMLRPYTFGTTTYINKVTWRQYGMLWRMCFPLQLNPCWPSKNLKIVDKDLMKMSAHFCLQSWPFMRQPMNMVQETLIIC